MHRRFALHIVVPLLLAATFAQAAESTDKVATQTRVLLQAAMQSHIDRTTVSGSYPVVDMKSGQVRKLHPAVGHPMVVLMGEYYVLCADFRDGAGQAVNVDFFVARDDTKFTVFQVEVANRAALRSLISAGVARML